MTRRRAAIAATGGLVLGAMGFVAIALRPPRSVADVHADAALVLSGDVDYLRVAYASRLLREGRVRHILLTGRGVGGDSAEAMQQRAIAAGVPAEAIVLETASTSTRENLVFAAPLIAEGGWHRIALVTSQSHLARAFAAARKAMPDVEWIAAPVPDAGPPERARRLRAEEALKLLWWKVRGWA